MRVVHGLCQVLPEFDAVVVCHWRSEDESPCSLDCFIHPYNGLVLEIYRGIEVNHLRAVQMSGGTTEYFQEGSIVCSPQQELLY